MTPEEKLVTKYLLTSEYQMFVRYFFAKLNKKKFIVADHHRIICEALDRVLRGECTRLIINIAPRYGKTELAVKNFIAAGLALNPAAKFIHLSYADDLARDNSEYARDIVTSAEYQELFPEVQLKASANAKNKWYTTAGGGVLARAAAGQVTGFGAGQVDEETDEELSEFLSDFELRNKFGGAIIIDDAIKPDDADRDTMRVKVNERYDSTIKNRVNSRKTPIIVIMQRLHPMDLAGYLMREDEADEWEVISLPCINKAGNRFGLEPGKALWPHKHTLEELKALERANPVVYARQYDQDPKPRHGLLFPEDELNFFDPAMMLDNERWDVAYKATFTDPANLGGDFFASVFTSLIGNKVYVTDVIFNKMGADHNEKAVANATARYRSAYCGVEGVLGWVESANRVSDMLSDIGWPGEFRVTRQRTAKHARILNRAAFIRNNFVFRSDWRDLPEYKDFMNNLTGYLKIQETARGNKNDDAPDVCEMAAVHYEQTFPELWPIFKK